MKPPKVQRENWREILLTNEEGITMQNASKESRWKCGGTGMEPENSAGIETEQGCLFLYVPSTIAPMSLFDLPFLGAMSHLKEGRP